MIFPYEVQEPVSQLTRFNFGTLAIMMISWIVFIPAVLVAALNLVKARHRFKGLLLPLFGIVVTVILIVLGAILLYLASDGAALLAQAQPVENELFPDPEVVLGRTAYNAIPKHLIIIFTLTLMTLFSSLWRLVVHIQISREATSSLLHPPKNADFSKTPNL